MSEPEPNTDEPEEEQLTETAKTRWEWLSTITAGFTIGTFLALVVGSGLGMVSLPSNPYMAGVFVATVVAAYTFSIGEDVTAIYKELTGGDS